MVQIPAGANPAASGEEAGGQARGAETPQGGEALARRAHALLATLPALLPALGDLYRDLHRHPELSGQEARTAAAVASHLEAAGYTLTREMGGHGVVGLLRNGAGPTVALRGDMDALPIAEETGLPYASTVTAMSDEGLPVPVMHACGHDVHTACLVGAAQLLAGARERWGGTLMIIGQPAEETMTGAAAMLADGLFSRIARPDVVLGQHVTNARAGDVIHRVGALFAADRAKEALVNDAGAVARLQTVHQALFGDAVWSAPAPIPFAAGEDFALYGLPGPGRYAGPPIPLAYWLLGSTAPDRWAQAAGSTYREKLHALPANHHAAFAPDPGTTLRRGVEALAGAALAFLGSPR